MRKDHRGVWVESRTPEQAAFEINRAMSRHYKACPPEVIDDDPMLDDDGP